LEIAWFQVRYLSNIPLACHGAALYEGDFNFNHLQS